MISITAQFLHQHKDKVMYMGDGVACPSILTYDYPLTKISATKLSFKMPLSPPKYCGWMWKWLNGRMHVEMQTKRRICLRLCGWKEYTFEPLLIKARINTDEVATSGYVYIDVDCILNTEQVNFLLNNL